MHQRVGPQAAVHGGGHQLRAEGVVDEMQPRRPLAEGRDGRRQSSRPSRARSGARLRPRRRAASPT